MAEADAIEARCQAAGLRLTASRRAVLAALRRADAPRDAPELLRIAQRQHADVRLGSVYRFLRDLERLGLARAEAQPHDRLRWRLHDHAGAAAPAGRDDALLAQLHAFLRGLETPGGGARPAPADTPEGASRTVLHLLQQAAARFGYRLAPLQPPAY